MTYLVRGTVHNYDLENILNIFGLEKVKEGADMALSVEEGWCSLHGEGVEFSTPLFYSDGTPIDKDELKRTLYRHLVRVFGEVSGWGILVGVRPVKLASQLLAEGATPEGAKATLMREYLLSEENAERLVRIAEYEDAVAPPKNPQDFERIRGKGRARRENASLYLSVPFCPTRCKYCSFPMQPLTTKRKLLPAYFEHLKVELEETLKMLAQEGVEIDCIYFGGGTPSTLQTDMIVSLGEIMRRYIDFSKLKEFTFEAGRSDTVTPELIDTLVAIGADRVSINPQSFTEAALAESLRERPEGEFENAFALARRARLKINSDLILGLAGEDESEYVKGLQYLIGLKPENITVHALSLKRGSPLFGEIQPLQGVRRTLSELKEYLASQRARYLSMSEGGARLLREAGYHPYYLYRQKRILANLENIGYCREGEGCLYNSRIMSERYSIFAVGTGGVTKVCYPYENRHEQVAGTRSVEDYIDHFPKVLERVESVRALIRGECIKV